MVLIIIKGIIFLLLIGPGIVGNLFIFVNYLRIFTQDTEKKFIHVLLLHLTFINVMMLFCKGLQKISVFGLRNFLDDAGCQMVIYMERVARGLSICTTCLLTMVQAIILSPRSSIWARFKPRSTWHLLPFFLCFWILSCLISINLISYIRNVQSLNKSLMNDYDNYCLYVADDHIKDWISLTPMALRDGLFQILMCSASVYILFLLYKHHQHALHLRNSRMIPKMAPEIRAARSVLLLMFCFLFFYWTETVVSLCLRIDAKNLAIVFKVLDLFLVGYASLSPFVMIHREVQLVSCWHTFIQPQGNLELTSQRQVGKSCMQGE